MAGLAWLAALLAVEMLTTPTWADQAPNRFQRLRTESEHLAQLAERTYERSATFRELVSDLEQSDVFVYMEFGQCTGGLKACLVFVSRSGPDRYLRVRLDRFLSTFHD